MTYLIRRGAHWHFRFRLPDDLRGRPVPTGAPPRLGQLINAKAARFKHEITQSLRTSRNSEARAKVGLLISNSELLVQEARRFLLDGPPRTLSGDVIAFLAERRASDILANDDALRMAGLGLDLTPLHSSLLIPTEGGSIDGVADSQAGMTHDDLGLLQHITDRMAEELRQAVALRRPPDWIRSAVDDALSERGVSLEPGSADRRSLDFAFLEHTQRAFRAIQQRNAGVFVATPPPPADPTAQHGPTLSEAFDKWRLGRLIPGMKVPSENTAAEAEYAIRRFKELHGDVRIGAITREQARSYVDALWQLPTRLPNTLERLPLPAVLARSDLHQYPRRAAGTLGKHITLISAIVAKAAGAHDIAYKGSGWTNPFHGLKPSVDDERDRDPLSSDELQTLLTSSIYTQSERPKGGKGEAAFWLPLLGLMTGGRLGELAQLRICDVRQEPAISCWYLDINDDGEGRRLKSRNAKRRIPLHPALIDAGFLRYVEMRREQSSAHDPLFPGLEPRGKKKQWGSAWSKWYNRWRQKRLGIGAGDVRKDFHSLRHTFKDLCRAARIESEHQDALLGHSAARHGVGARYGSAIPIQLLLEDVKNLKPHPLIEKLRWKSKSA